MSTQLSNLSLQLFLQSIYIHNYQIPFWKSLPSAVSPINLYLHKLLSNTLLEFSPFSSFSHQPMSTQLPNLFLQLFLQSIYIYTQLSNSLLEIPPFSCFSHQPVSTKIIIKYPSGVLSLQQFLSSTYVYTIIKSILSVVSPINLCLHNYQITFWSSFPSSVSPIN